MPKIIPVSPDVGIGFQLHGMIRTGLAVNFKIFPISCNTNSSLGIQKSVISLACNFYVWQHPHSEQCEQFNSSNGVVVVAVSSSAQHCVTVPLCFPTFTCPPPMPPTHASLQCSRFEQFQRSARRQPLHPIRLQHVGASLALGTGIDARGTAGNLCSKEGEQRNSDGAQDTTWAIIYSQRSAQSESNFKHPSHKSPPPLAMSST